VIRALKPVSDPGWAALAAIPSTTMSPLAPLAAAAVVELPVPALTAVVALDVFFLLLLHPTATMAIAASTAATLLPRLMVILSGIPQKILVSRSLDNIEYR
jgi:hypothetical protein